MTQEELEVIRHCIKNGRFYTEKVDRVWNGLIEKGYAVAGGGWEEDMAYFFVTEEGKAAYLQTL